jgi:hypothetical protein
MLDAKIEDDKATGMEKKLGEVSITCYEFNY